MGDRVWTAPGVLAGGGLAPGYLHELQLLPVPSRPFQELVLQLLELCFGRGLPLLHFHLPLRLLLLQATRRLHLVVR